MASGLAYRGDDRVAARSYYDAVGQGPYRFFYGIENPIAVRIPQGSSPTYLQFVAIAAVAQWLIDRAATPPAEAPAMLAVNDGAVTHLIPVALRSNRSGSAGNYVEIVWRSREPCSTGRPWRRSRPNSATRSCASTAGKLVRRAAIRRVETDKSGDFTVELA